MVIKMTTDYSYTAPDKTKTKLQFLKFSNVLFKQNLDYFHFIACITEII